MLRLTSTDAAVGRRVRKDVERWLDDAQAASMREGEREAFQRIAIKHAWLVGDEEEEGELRTEAEGDAPLCIERWPDERLPALAGAPSSRPPRRRQGAP